MFWKQQWNFYLSGHYAVEEEFMAPMFFWSQTLKVVIPSSIRLPLHKEVISSSIIIYSSSQTHSFPYFIQLKWIFIWTICIKVMPKTKLWSPGPASQRNFMEYTVPYAMLKQQNEETKNKKNIEHCWLMAW